MSEFTKPHGGYFKRHQKDILTHSLLTRNKECCYFQDSELRPADKKTFDLSPFF